MGNMSIRNLDEDVMRRLKDRASRHGRSMEEEARTILSEAVKPSREEWIARLDALRNGLQEKHGTFPDSTALIREDRDSR